MRWRRVFMLGATCALVIYLGAAGSIYWFVRHHRGIEDIGFLHVALPWRWDEARVVRGEHNIRAARLLLHDKKFNEALVYLGHGLARAPAHREGRMLLADLFFAANRPDRARPILLEGLAYHGGDPVYLKRVFATLLDEQADGQVVELAEKLLGSGRHAGEASNVVACAAATASYLRGNYDRAEEYLKRVPRLAESRDGRFLAAKIENDRGYRELALLQLRQLAAEFSRDAEIQHELIRWLRSRGLSDEARRASLAFQLSHPQSALARIELLRAYQEAGDMTLLEREADGFLREFASHRDGLLACADFAANTGNIALARRIAAQARTGDGPLEPFSLLVTEALIVAGDFKGAIEECRRVQQSSVGLPERYQGLFESLQAIAHFGLGDHSSARAFLTTYLQRRDLRANNLLAIANRLTALSGGELARTVLIRATEIDAKNQAAMARLVECDIMLNRVDALAAHVQKFLQLRRPSPDILRVAQQKMGSDLFLFSKDTPAALNAIRLAMSPRQSAGSRP